MSMSDLNDLGNLARAFALSAAAVAMSGGCGSDDGAPETIDDDETSTDTLTPSTGQPTTTFDPETSDSAEDSTGFFPICSPGELRCAEGNGAVEICADTGLSWEVDIECGEHSTCQPCTDENCGAPLCIGPCQLSLDDPSSAGCAFVANRQLHKYGDAPDGLVITNPSEDLVAKVQVFAVPEGLLAEEPLVSYDLQPSTSEVLELSSDFVPGLGTNLRTGGIFRVYSDTPVISYLHAPLQANLGNESSLLLPDQVLGTDYVVSSFTSRDGVGVSYFEIVALEDGTTVEWTPTVNTAGNGLPIDPVAAGETGTLILNRYETMRVVPSEVGLPKDDPEADARLDLSGTVIHSDKDIWVTGANRMSRIPFEASTADQLQEVLLPLQHWGKEYVLPSARPRGDLTEFPDQPQNYWRIYAARDDVEIVSDPPHPDFPLTLGQRGDYVDVTTEHGENLFLSSTGTFLPVLYLRSRIIPAVEKGEEDSILPYGDPAMVQMVPTEQFLARYVFATGVGFAHNSVQFIRPAGGAEIKLISEAGLVTDVVDFETVGEFEVASLDEIGSGTFVAESDTPFGIIQSGHTSGIDGDTDCFVTDTECNGTYAYPGGMRAETIFTP